MSAKNAGTELVLAIDYGGRDEITKSPVILPVRWLQELSVWMLSNENAVSSRLYTANLPEVDLMIRTGGDMRVSNFLLWQLSYSEIGSPKSAGQNSPVKTFFHAIREFNSRQRRFGGLNVNE